MVQAKNIIRNRGQPHSAHALVITWFILLYCGNCILWGQLHFCKIIIIIHSHGDTALYRLHSNCALIRFCELSVTVLSTAEPIWTDSSTKRDWVWSPQKFDLLFLQRAATSETRLLSRSLDFPGVPGERLGSLIYLAHLPGQDWDLSLWERGRDT